MKSFFLVDKSCHRRKEEVFWVRSFFRLNGWNEARAAEAADCTILFTCAEMRYKVSNMVREIESLSLRIRRNSAFIVGSCLPNTDPDTLSKVFRGPTITPTDFSALNSLPDIRIKVESMPPAFGKDSGFVQLDRLTSSSAWDAIPYGLSRWTAKFLSRCFPGDGSKHIAATLRCTRRMVIYVSAGCANHCSYCAIRFATGQVRSKPPGLVVEHIAQGLRQGYRTFDLLSDSIGGYGLDIGSNLGDLLTRIRTLPGRFTIGISDLRPLEFIRYFPEIVSLCEAQRLHYLYVPIQSGNERILRLMNRPCNVGDLMAKFLTVRSYDEVFLQSGIIVGFPGETEAEFEDTLAVLQRIGFDNVYVHYYCDMPNTISSKLPDKADKAAMVLRLNKLSHSGIRYNHAKTWNEWSSTMAIT